ncbi:hypothetical protein BH23CHL1_BH23CHL1_25250 [soil metagenome]
MIRLSPESRGALRDGVVELAMTCHSGDMLKIFIEPFLIVVGDSPVSAALLKLDRPLGFRIVAMAAGSVRADEIYHEPAIVRILPSRVPFVIVATMGTNGETALLLAAIEPVHIHWLATVAALTLLRITCPRAVSVTISSLRSTLQPAWTSKPKPPAEIALSILAQIIPIRRAASHRVPALVAAPLSAIVIDSICGMEVDLATAKFTLVVDGETLGFCCPACLRKFEQASPQEDLAYSKVASGANGSSGSTMNQERNTAGPPSGLRF